MAESSDSLLLSKKASKLNKGSDGLPGTLLITESKLKWQPDDRGAAKPVVIEIASITRQQQAPGKPFLRILSASESLGLSFDSEYARDEILEFLKQLRPPAATAGGSGSKAGRPAAGVPSEAQRRQIFASDKDQEALYHQLVTSGILTDVEFWQAWRKQHGAAFASGGSSNQNPRGVPVQRTGLSSVIHEVESLHDGQTERVNIHLTPQDIQRIFVERPEVHQAYLAHVPHTLSETKFWQMYFKLEYKKAARRKRLVAAGRTDVADEDLNEGDTIFAPFSRQLAEQESIRGKSRMESVDPGVNLAAEFADRWGRSGFGSVHGGEGDGVTDHPMSNTTQYTSNHAPDASSTPRTTAFDSIARELNRHAARVLDGPPEGLVENPEDSSTVVIAAKVAAAVQAQAQAQAKFKTKSISSTETAGNQQGRGDEHSRAASLQMKKEWHARAVSALEDLTPAKEPEVIPLPIIDPRLYFAESRALNQAAAGTAVKSLLNGDNLGEGTAAAALALAQVDPTTLSNPPCDPAAAVAALIEIGRDEDEALIAEFGPIASSVMGTHPAEALGSVMVEFFRLECLTTNEMLRHLWGCFPLTSELRRTKATRLVKHVEEKKKNLAVHMASAPGTAQQVYIAQMVRPMIAALEAALERHREELLGNISH